MEALGGILEDLGGILDGLGRNLKDFGRILEAKMEAPTRDFWRGGGLWKENLSEDKNLPSDLEHAHPLPKAGGGGSNCAAALGPPLWAFIIGQPLKD